MQLRYALALPLLLLASSVFAEEPQPPSVQFQELYRDVEMARIFPDQKTFADAVPRGAPAAILAEYRHEKDQAGFDLRTFVHRHFIDPVRPAGNAGRAAHDTMRAYIARMWTVLERKPSKAEANSSLLPLSKPYVVPGGRFSEIYYWDSYFTMLGLEQDRRGDLARDMLQNFANLIDRYGHIPNGNRSYYLSRSQPPFFACMVALVADHDGDAVYRRYLKELQAEYDYWMEGADALAPGAAHRHLVRLSDGTLLNRYWDDRAAPRDESYLQDVTTAAQGQRPASEVYREIRAGAETGWDYSARWLAGDEKLENIRTTDVLPVDLNTLMVNLEQTLGRAYALAGDDQKAGLYQQKASARAEAIRRVMWDAETGTFADYLWKQAKPSPIFSVAAAYPLTFGIATTAQGRSVAAALRARLLQPGGLATTTQTTGQQWDAPNGWAPLQYMAVEGLRTYGEDDLAGEIATRWLRETNASFRRTGVLFEKYDVTQPPDLTGGTGGKGGEYVLQVGFGWTNGVAAALMAQYPDAVSASQ